ncbi:uncharacterized protein LOC143277126 [Babylonia areolata]|uniref:uncharacterized protein LOC143277126 n=1 Tax=Babylonia areolata TaxID=304850 RepID=UPI003FD4A663
MTTSTAILLTFTMCLGLLAAIHGLPASAERGLAGMPSGPSAEKAPVKRDLSINQPMRSLANYLLGLEYDRISSNNEGREFLRKIGKRGVRLVSDDDDVEGDFGADDEVVDLLPFEPFEGSWSRW